MSACLPHGQVWGSQVFIPSIIITGYYVYVSMELMLNVLCRSNPLGARGNIAQRYGELVKDLWSATARSIAPLKLRVNLNCLSHPSVLYTALTRGCYTSMVEPQGQH